MSGIKYNSFLLSHVTEETTFKKNSRKIMSKISVLLKEIKLLHRSPYCLQIRFETKHPWLNKHGYI
jgi:hypothetical protein